MFRRHGVRRGASTQHPSPSWAWVCLWAATSSWSVGCGEDQGFASERDFGKLPSRDAASEVGSFDAGSSERGLADAGSPPRSDGGSSQSVVQQVAATLDIEWRSCSLYTGVPIGQAPGAADHDAGAADTVPEAECATIELPLRWHEPSGEQLEWFVKRLDAKEASRGQLWLLQGGPGSPGTGMEPIAADLHETVSDLDIYIPDHRGVGRSTLFECVEAKSRGGSGANQLAQCAKEVVRDWGTATVEFSTTAASRDVLAVATQMHRADEEVIIRGSSYGGYWAHRILQLDEPALVTAAVIDSAVLPIGGLSTMYQVLRPNEAGQRVLEECAADETCRERLGPDPEQRALEIMASLCEPIQARGGRPALQSVLSAALREWRLLRLIPAMLYRAERCSEADIEYLDAFAGLVPDFARVESHEAPRSTALFTNVAYSEIVSELSGPQEILDAAETAVFSDLSSAVDLSSALEHWPLYPADEYIGQWADTEVKLLLLHGGLDTQTPANEGWAVAEQFQRPGQQAFFFPTGGHGLYYRTHELKDDAETRCGQHITVQFLRDPEAKVDGSCIDDTEPLDFSAHEQLLLELAGHTDVWDNP